MKSIASFPDTISASIAQGMLEANGIRSVIDNQAMDSLYPAPLSGLSEVNLMVNERDAGRAIEPLKESNDGDCG